VIRIGRCERVRSRLGEEVERERERGQGRREYGEIGGVGGHWQVMENSLCFAKM
jgi:hypothetical protein